MFAAVYRPRVVEGLLGRCRLENATKGHRRDALRQVALRIPGTAAFQDKEVLVIFVHLIKPYKKP